MLMFSLCYMAIQAVVSFATSRLVYQTTLFHSKSTQHDSSLEQTWVFWKRSFQGLWFESRGKKIANGRLGDGGWDGSYFQHPLAVTGSLLTL